MAYVRDDKTGKFAWVEGALGEDERPRAAARSGSGVGAEVAPNQLLVVLLVVGMVGALAWAGVRMLKDTSVAIRRIRNHPADFDGQQVRVRGQVGEVFEVGGSYAYFLMQGRDTIVVFSRHGRPSARANAEVRGSVSIGYLDGAPRPALFESN